MKTRKFLIGLAIGVLIFSVSVLETNAQYQYAGWVDRSDELPGMISDGEMLLIAGGAVVVIGGLVTFLIIKKKQDKKLEAALPEFRVFPESVYINSYQYSTGSLQSLCNEINRTNREASVLLYTKLDKIPSANYSSSGVVSLGMRINF